MASSSTSSIEALERLLDKGEVGPFCDSCCPCGDIYIFASVETYLQFEEAVGWAFFTQNCPDGNSFKLQCCTDDCLDKIGAFAGEEVVDLILDKGYVEFSLLGGKSMLCTLYDYIIQQNLTGTAAADAIGGILDKGIVYQCEIDKDTTDGDQSKTIFASVETYLKYAEAAVDTSGPCAYCPQCDPPITPSDPCQCLPEPCCFSIKASVETYLKYTEAVG
jgi:hypothetical protein